MAQRTVTSRASASREVGKSRGRWNRETHVRHRDYSPTLGRFIERDPIGFEAGDNNWYRFVVNGPAGTTDPSGLCGQFTVSGHTTAERTSAVHIAAAAAANRIADAILLLEKHPEKVAAYAKQFRHRPIGKLADCDYLKTFLSQLKRVPQPCGISKVPFFVDKADSGIERDAYVNFFIGTNIVSSSVIHLTPRFFTNPDERQIEVLLHEMGRFYNSLGESNTGTKYDVYVWDGIIESLYKRQQDIMDISSACSECSDCAR